jgi:pimeloyl-ACP methyl ester carboxylesterase
MSRRAIRRLAVVAALAVVAYVVGFGAYGLVFGSSEYLSGEPRSTACGTPGSRFGWAYEAVNYDLADDTALLAANPDPTRCATQGAEAGMDVVSPDGTHLAGWFVPKAEPGSGGPAVVIVHGGKSDKSGMLPYAPALHDRYDLLIVDLRNSGRSSRADSTGGVREQADLRAMLNWLERTRHPSWIAVVGNSNGAATALAEALNDQRVRALVLDSMHAQVERQLGNVIVTEKGLPAWPAAWAVVTGVGLRLGEPLDSVDPVRTITMLQGRPVLLTHGLDDTIDRPADSLELNVAAAREAGLTFEVQTCPGAGHGQVVEVCAAEWASWVQAFLAANGGA